MITIGDGSNGYPINRIERERAEKMRNLKEANEELLEVLELIVQRHKANEPLDGAISVAVSYIAKHREAA